MATEQLATDYDRWHEHRLANETDAVMQQDHFACWHQMVLERLGAVDGLRIAEIGCGRGNFAIYLAQQGARVTALDFSDRAITIARQRSQKIGVDVDWHVGDACATGLPDATFDLVISCECMEHVPTPHTMMQELARLMRPGGRLLLTTPSQLNAQLLGWLHAWWKREPYNSGSGVQPHENLFFTCQINRSIRRAGLRVTGRDATIFPWLLLPRVSPNKLRFHRVRPPWLVPLGRPFGLHQLYEANKPQSSS